MRLANRVAIVTGSSRGLGKAFALGLAREGADMVVTSRTQSAVDQVAAEIAAMDRRALALRVDVSDEVCVRDLVEKVLKEFGKIDILVNNAGIVTPFREVVDLPVGRLIYSIGDAHIYENHVDAVKEYLARTPKPLPTLYLNPEVRDVFKFRTEDIRLINYESHPAIQAEIAV